jgi:S-adenosylmethionine-diacylgycerolhomoserine-N-methlytransferase
MTAAVAESMDRIYRTQRHFYDLTRKYYLLGRDRLIGGLAVPNDGRLLEIGCGTGRNLIIAARAWPQARCFGFDISNAMLETAAASVARAGQEARIRLARGDAAGFDPQAMFGVAAFDRIMMSYTLSMIPPWREAIVAAVGALAPGGTLHIVDFGQQERLPGAFRRGLHAWLRKFEVTPRADLETELRRVAAERGLLIAFRSLYGGYAWSAVLARPCRNKPA